jgi:hypothetical protein
LAALALALALGAPRLLAPLNWVWTKLGLLLHRIVSPIFLLLLFYGCIAPVGLLMRLSGKDPLRLKYEPAATSYWIVRTLGLRQNHLRISSRHDCFIPA